MSFLRSPENNGRSLKRLTLSFHDKELNRLYTNDFVCKSLNFARISLFLAIAIYLLFALLDSFVMTPEASAIVWKFRLTGVTVFIIAIILTYNQKIVKFYQLMMIGVIILGGSPIIFMIMYSGSVGYYAGLILALIYAHSLLRLRFIAAALCTWVLVAFYEIAVHSITPSNILVSNTFFIVSANILGMFSSYGIEYYMRMAFLRSLMVEEKSRLLEAEYGRKSKELEDARQIQLSMIPQNIPEHPLYDIAFIMRTASEVGGDFFDIIISDDGTITFAVGDATGHGAKAGAMVTAMKFLFSNYAEKMDIVEFMKKADRSFRQMRLPRLYMSFTIGRIKGDEIEATGAGMPAMTMFNCAYGKLCKLSLKGLPLGSSTFFEYKKHMSVMSSNDVLLIMTDGLPELFNNKKETIGYEKVEREFIKLTDMTPKDIVNNLMTMADNWMGDYPQQDDITLVVIKKKEVKVKPVQINTRIMNGGTEPVSGNEERKIKVR